MRRSDLESVPFLAMLGLTCSMVGCPSPSSPDQLPEGPPTASGSAHESATAPPAADAGKAPPVAVKRPVVDTYHGVAVPDDYRWLEKGDAPEVAAWSSAQNDFARSWLDAREGRKELSAKLKSIMGFESPDWYGLKWRGGRLFAVKDAPPKQQPFIVVMKSADDPGSEKVVLDPNAVDAKGETSMDFYQPSPDGKLVAVSLSKGGSESGTVHVYEVDSGKERAVDTIPRVNGGTAGGSLAWLADSSGFFYTRYPAPGERPEADLNFYQQVYFHALGADPKGDRPSLTQDLPRIAEIQLEVSRDGKYAIASVANGDGGEFDQWIVAVGKDVARRKQDPWRRLASLPDEVVEAHFAPDGEVWLRSRKGAPRGKLLKVAPKGALADAKVVVPESDGVIDTFVVTATRVHTTELVGGPYRVRSFDKSGKDEKTIALPPIASVYGIARLDGDDVLLRTETYVEPPAWELYTAKKGALASTPLHKRAAVNLSDIEVIRETCQSKDGTKVPINILRKKGTKLDGSNPFLLYGYGGYGISESPWFDARLRIWFDAGGVYADTNLRGGGEMGEDWHKAGSLTHKQNVFDDFLACARHVVDAGYTKPERLAIQGGSNGGLLMGAALTQAPQLFRAVVSQVGIYDMLRVETTPNGAFNVTEFGTVKDKAQFDALFAYSPYHHVKDGEKYPSTLFMTGANDPRVDPYNSRKMVARLQAANASARPILLRTSGNTGHGIGTPLEAQIEEQTDVWSFLLSEVAGRK